MKFFKKFVSLLRGKKYSQLIKENEILKKQLYLEKHKSAYWKLVSQGHSPIIFGSDEDIKYIKS